MAKTKNFTRFLTKQYDIFTLSDRFFKKTWVFFYLLFLFVVGLIFVSALTRIIDFNHDKPYAQMTIVNIVECSNARYSATCKVNNSEGKRKYLGIDPSFIQSKMPKPGDQLWVYEFPDGHLENNLNISGSYINLVTSAIVIIAYIAISVVIYKVKTQKA